MHQITKGVTAFLVVILAIAVLVLAELWWVGGEWYRFERAVDWSAGVFFSLLGLFCVLFLSEAVRSRVRKRKLARRGFEVISRDRETSAAIRAEQRME
jgi:hypothetical protein